MKSIACLPQMVVMLMHISGFSNWKYPLIYHLLIAFIIQKNIQNIFEFEWNTTHALSIESISIKVSQIMTFGLQTVNFLNDLHFNWNADVCESAWAVSLKCIHLFCQKDTKVSFYLKLLVFSPIASYISINKSS